MDRGHWIILWGDEDIVNLLPLISQNNFLSTCLDVGSFKGGKTEGNWIEFKKDDKGKSVV